MARYSCCCEMFCGRLAVQQLPRPKGRRHFCSSRTSNTQQKMLCCCHPQASDTANSPQMCPQSCQTQQALFLHLQLSRQAPACTLPSTHRDCACQRTHGHVKHSRLDSSQAGGAPRISSSAHHQQLAHVIRPALKAVRHKAKVQRARARGAQHLAAWGNRPEKMQAVISLKGLSLQNTASADRRCIVPGRRWSQMRPAADAGRSSWCECV